MWSTNRISRFSIGNQGFKKQLMSTRKVRADGGFEMKKLRPKIIRIVTVVVAIVGVTFLTALDSDSYIPAIVSTICAAWCGLVATANTK